MANDHSTSIDFNHAVLDWETKDTSHGRWRVIALAAKSETASDVEKRFVLTPMVMAGNVYGGGRLPVNPAYSYQFAASTSRHIIFRDYGAGSPPQDTADVNSQLFTSIKISLPQRCAKRILPEGLAPEPSVANWPLSARISMPLTGKKGWVLEFPINHINCTNKKGALEFQVETGPLLIPQEAVVASECSKMGGFVLAYIFFNRLDQADLLVFSPTTSAGFPRNFSRYQRLDNIEITLFGTPDGRRCDEK